MNIPENLRYNETHEWVRIEGDEAVVGITDHAQAELTDIVFVELPAVGKSVKQHDSFGTIEAVKAVSDLYVPVSGSVVEVNEDLASSAELVNKDPYGKGWMVKIKLSKPDEVSELLSASAYKALVGK